MHSPCVAVLPPADLTYCQVRRHRLPVRATRQDGASTPELFVALFVCSYFCFGNSALVTGPIATESAPVGLVASAIGVVVGAGVLFSGVASTIAYGMAGAYGYQTVGWVALAGAALGIFVCAFVKETGPLKAVKNLGTVGGTGGGPLFEDIYVLLGLTIAVWLVVDAFRIPNLVRSGQHDM